MRKFSAAQDYKATTDFLLQASLVADSSNNPLGKSSFLRTVGWFKVELL